MSVNDPIDTVNPMPDGACSETVRNVNENPPASFSDSPPVAVGGDRAGDTPHLISLETVWEYEEDIQQRMNEAQLNGQLSVKRTDLLSPYEDKDIADRVLCQLVAKGYYEIKRGYVHIIPKTNERSWVAIGKQVVIDNPGSRLNGCHGKVERHSESSWVYLLVNGKPEWEIIEHLKPHTR